MDFTSSTMKLNINNDTGFLTYNKLSQIPFINHAFSTRLGGVSTGDFSSMNLSFGRGDSDENVIKNYHCICNAAGFDYNTLVASAQDHHTVVRKVTEREYGVGIYKPKDKQSVDALITNKPHVTLVTYYADCTPLFFVDVVNKVIALAHAGWRGTADKIGEKVINVMTTDYNCNPKNIVVAIGPAISKCCYEIDEGCALEFKQLTDLDINKFLIPKSNSKYMLDLLEVNKQIIISTGVKPQNLVVSDVCTRCNNNLLWSHRATGGRRGGLAAFMCIK